MTLGLIIPLKAKRISRDWDITCAMLEETIGSISRQSRDAYIAVIVGHDRPDFLTDVDNSRIVFKTVDSAIPDRDAPGFTTQDLIDDKVLKIIAGLNFLKSDPPSYIFQLDSDDLIHKDFVKVIHETPDSVSGFILKKGYLFYKSQKRYIETENLDGLCGSTVVARTDAVSLPDDICLDQKYNFPWTKYRHMNAYKYFTIDNDLKLGELNERMVAYVLSTGDNFSDRWRDSWLKRLRWYLKPYIQGKSIGPEFERNFLE